MRVEVVIWVEKVDVFMVCLVWRVKYILNILVVKGFGFFFVSM